jgi:hypothetical protein
VITVGTLITTEGKGRVDNITPEREKEKAKVASFTIMERVKGKERAKGKEKEKEKVVTITMEMEKEREKEEARYACIYIDTSIRFRLEILFFHFFSIARCQ